MPIPYLSEYIDMKYIDIFKELSIEITMLGVNCSVDNLISRFEHLEGHNSYLNISNMDLDVIPMGILPKLSLDNLNLSVNNISFLPQNIDALKSLRSLYLSKNKLSELPNSIGKLSNLRRFGIRGNTISDVPDSIGDLIKLTDLDLSNNKFRKIHASISQLKNLRILRLGFNNIDDIHEDFVTHNLESLYLRNNGISKLPEGFADLKKLKFLDIRFNQFTKVPKALYHMENLQELHIMGNNFQFPDKIANLDKIEWELSPDHRYYLDKEGEYYKLSNLRYNDYDDYHHNIKPEKVIRYYAPDSIPSFIK